MNCGEREREEDEQITIDGREQMKKTNDIGDLEAEERNK